MPVLKNAKHEQFVQLVIQGARYGWSQAEIYQRAGYKASGHSAAIAGSRLMKKDVIQRRLAELAAPAVKKTRVTIESLIDQFDQVFSGASNDKQWGAAGSAAATKARLVGYLRDKLEIGAPGSFDSMTEPEQVIDALIEDAGSAELALEQLAGMMAMVEARAADRAKDITPLEPALHQGARGEAEKAVALLQRGPKKQPRWN